MRELRVLVSPRVHVHRLAQESAWVGHAVRSLGDGSRWRGISDMCELSMLMRTWVLAATTAGTTSTWAALLLLLLSLRALLLLRLLGALLLLAEGRVGTLAPNRTELVRVRALTTMTALTLLPMQNCSLSDIRDATRLVCCCCCCCYYSMPNRCYSRHFIRGGTLTFIFFTVPCNPNKYRFEPVSRPRWKITGFYQPFKSLSSIRRREKKVR